MSTKEAIRRQVGRVWSELLERGQIILKAPVLLQGMECGIRFLLGAVLSGAQIFESYAPFGLGLVGASGSGAGGFFALCGVCLGYLSTLGLVQGLRYAASAILIYSVAFAFYDVRIYASRWFMPLISALLGAATGFVYLSEAGWTPSGVICFLTEVLLIGGSAAVYRYAFSLWSDPAEGLGPDPRQRISLALAGVTLLIALAHVELLWGISLGRALAALAVMALAWRWGVGPGAASGVAAGLAMDLSVGIGTPVYAMAYGFAGLLTGVAWKQNRLMAALAYVMGSGSAVLWTWSAGIPTAILYEVFLASVLFLLLPEAAFQRLDAFQRASPPAGTKSRTYSYVRDRLDAQAAAFRSLYEQLRSSLLQNTANDNDAAIIFDRTADRICRGCALRDACWQRDYVTTFNALNDALPAMLDRGRGEAKDFPSHFSSRCLHFADFLTAANAELTTLLARRQYSARLRESRGSVCRQYAELSTILSTAAAELSVELTPDPVLEQKLRAHLRGQGVDAESSVYYDEHGHLRVELEGPDLSAFERAETQERLAGALNVSLRPGTPVLTGRGWKLVLTQAAPMAATVGIAARRKDGETVSGDAGTWFKTEDGRVYLILCDGMGAGEEAASESKLALRLLEGFLRAGVDPEPALRTLSGALALRGDQSVGFTTIDLLRVDLFSGDAEVYKMGAAPTYIRKKGQVSRITGSSLPAGLDPSGGSAPDVSRLHLSPEDLVLLISDGVADSRDDSWVRGALAVYSGGSPKELALQLLQQSQTHASIRDDRTALVLTLS
ncbi:MAG: SpoIIE family protein phosphatase [Oscillospiraceae bacterium]|nr:SpoIIE family protein phosphatase [Oscillospiraceae bacterium]